MEKKLTRQQQKALHLMFKQLAEELTNAGLDMKKTLKADIEIMWDAKLVKRYLWRPIQEEICGKESTKDITTEEINQTFDVINKAIGEKFGLHVDFPSIETLINKLEEYGNNK